MELQHSPSWKGPMGSLSPAPSSTQHHPNSNLLAENGVPMLLSPGDAAASDPTCSWQETIDPFLQDAFHPLMPHLYTQPGPPSPWWRIQHLLLLILYNWWLLSPLICKHFSARPVHPQGVNSYSQFGIICKLSTSLTPTFTSFTVTLKRTGPKFESWGTPQVSGCRPV